LAFVYLENQERNFVMIWRQILGRWLFQCELKWFTIMFTQQLFYSDSISREFLYQSFLSKMLCPVYHHYYKEVITLSDSHQLRLCGSSFMNIAHSATHTHVHVHTHTHTRQSSSGKWHVMSDKIRILYFSFNRIGSLVSYNSELIQKV
jgi:hypothetical protein